MFFPLLDLVVLIVRAETSDLWSEVSINDNHWVNTFSLLLFFLLILLDLSVGKVAAILFEVFELMRHGTKALFGEELVWFENMGLTNEEVATLQLRVFC